MVLARFFTGHGLLRGVRGRIAEFCYLCGVDGHWLLTGRGVMMAQALPTSTPTADPGAAMEMAILAVEQGIAAQAAQLDPARRTALTMLAWEQVQGGKQGTALETFVRHLLALAETPLNPEEKALVNAFRNATPEQRFLITRHVAIGTVPAATPQDAKRA